MNVIFSNEQQGEIGRRGPPSIEEVTKKTNTSLRFRFLGQLQKSSKLFGNFREKKFGPSWPRLKFAYVTNRQKLSAKKYGQQPVAARLATPPNSEFEENGWLNCEVKLFVKLAMYWVTSSCQQTEVLMLLSVDLIMIWWPVCAFVLNEWTATRNSFISVHLMIRSTSNNQAGIR